MAFFPPLMAADLAVSCAESIDRELEEASLEAVEKLQIAENELFFLDKSEPLRQITLGKVNPALEDRWKRSPTRVI